MTKPRRILFLSHTDAFGPFRVGSHHLAREFSLAGHDVTHISTPRSTLHRALGRGSRRGGGSALTPIVDADGVRHVVPRTLLPAGLPPRMLSSVSRTGRYDIILIDQPLMWSSRLTRSAKVVIYRPTDTYPSGIKASLQRRALSQVAAVVATSSEVLESLGQVAVPSLVLENGVEFARFHAGRGDSQVALYVGAIDARFDVSAIDDLARAYPDWQFVVAGDARMPVEHENVRQLGTVPYDELPALMQTARIGLIPLTDHPANAGRSPMKRYEYLASGLHVVTRETPELRTDRDRGIYAYRGRDDLLSMFAEAAAASPVNRNGRELAQSMAWHARASALMEFIESNFAVELETRRL